ncbi:hypothetical protein PGT21_000556 [Puccinia graminis f. sp. tritici]|uniref:Uncharacterized protein n=1 Tax=Puccinia graminis f. sp. tritici TaxID=56615 RepID=A0A5B0MVQ8_PUCGR|nr:hypothetical protein PGT21_000556 [Puccinia graminis f. sp. tritici]KAA1090349.1 hypothetical protein PGTUg99_005768 [Puccinia graminis f. sp. tritici]
MVLTRSSKPEVVLPNFTSRVTPPRTNRAGNTPDSPSLSPSSFHSVPDPLEMSDGENHSDSAVPGSFPSAFKTLSSLFSSTPRRPAPSTPPFNLGPAPSTSPFNPVAERPVHPKINFVPDAPSTPVPPLKEDDHVVSGDLPPVSSKGKGKEDAPDPSSVNRSGFQDDTKASGSIDGLLTQVLGDARFKGMDDDMLCCHSASPICDGSLFRC